jgi:hypothetical protein
MTSLQGWPNSFNSFKLTLWSRVLLEKLIVTQLVKKFPAFYGTRRFLLLLSLAPQPSLGLGLLQKMRLNFLEASQQFSFLRGRVVSPTPNPHPGGPGLCIYIPQRQSGLVIPLGTHFSRLLRHAWVMVGLFLRSQ